MTTPADELRAAAAALRARAVKRAVKVERGLAAAFSDDTRDLFGKAIPDRSAMDPGVGLALADWLDETATEVTAAEGTEYALHPDGGAFASWEAALAVARAVNGSAS